MPKLAARFDAEGVGFADGFEIFEIVATSVETDRANQSRKKAERYRDDEDRLGHSDEIASVDLERRVQYLAN